ncbi:OmpA family protein [Sulfurirhabdus autotrophica]|uniref:OOP family OmpA-OmpF porin n=1 Tax=Sulfurirhabdus autotrophica TaxID=1706046 RepID=A0A4R3XW28_9PROT|nr:OmpA family protein [Sulfurirhabdus autotrophica]TCV81090.1 OOP family OmpA-OmpF porin [Sulfurirhabdus autotrophica]
MRYIWIALLPLLATNQVGAQNYTPETASPNPGQVVVNGTVPDEASKIGVLTRLRELYGADKVVDQIAVGSVVAPANWNAYVQKLINPNLKLISRGQFKIDGNVVSVRGEVANESQRQQIASEIATSLNSTYTVNNGLRVSSSQQGILDQALSNRTIEFDSGKATLTSSGKSILDEMLTALLKLKGQKFEIIGHTDNQGLRSSNLALSKARADEVKSYFSDKGINSELMTTFGQGSERPIASNDTVDGRARNRRIEFRIAQ